MQTSNVVPHAIVKPKRSWLPSINRDRIIQFLKTAYQLDDGESTEYQKLNVKEQDKFPSVGRKVS